MKTYQKRMKKICAFITFVFIYTLFGQYLPFYGIHKSSDSIVDASGRQTIGDLEIGDKVVDNSWQWEHRLGNGYSHLGGNPGNTISKPVVWIVVAKDHYYTNGGVKNSGVTLLSEEIIGRHIFDNSSDRGSPTDSNHWGDSGCTDATLGLRKFLNGSSYDYDKNYTYTYVGDPAANGDDNNYNVAFYDAFSFAFKKALNSGITTCRANDSYNSVHSVGIHPDYSTADKVFLPSMVELNGSTGHNHINERLWPYFTGAVNADRVAMEANGTARKYWTRSPRVNNSLTMNIVWDDGIFFLGASDIDDFGIRPAVNISSKTNVSSVPNVNGVYEIEHFIPPKIGDLEVGDKVVDLSWVWEHRTGDDYSHEGDNPANSIIKSVTWIVVAKDHYGEGGVTLLSEEIIGRHAFDNSKDRVDWQGSNHWGDTGCTDATLGLRKFLNGSSYDYGNGYAGGYIGAPEANGDNNAYSASFYDAFSPDFQEAVIVTEVPCLANDRHASPYRGEEYATLDKVFLPSKVELSSKSGNNNTSEEIWPYFIKNNAADRIAMEANKVVIDYWWSRTPEKDHTSYQLTIGSVGVISVTHAGQKFVGIRPAVTLSSDTLISLTLNTDLVYEMSFVKYGDVDGDGYITVTDAIMVLRQIVGLLNLDSAQLARAKVNGEENLSVTDAIMILRNIVGILLYENFPVHSK